LGYLAFGRGLVPSGSFLHRLLVKITFSVLPLFLIPSSFSSLCCFSCAAFLVLDSLLFFTRLHSASRCIHYPNYTVNRTTVGGHGCGGGHIYGLMGSYGCLGMKRWERRDKCNMSFHGIPLSLFSQFQSTRSISLLFVVPWQESGCCKSRSCCSHSQPHHICSRGGHHKQSGPVAWRIIVVI
jgi:hypothetical protein